MGEPSQFAVDGGRPDPLVGESVDTRLARSPDSMARTALNISPEKRAAIEDLLRKGTGIVRIAQMPPLAHDWKNPDRSEVLRWIQDSFSYDLEQSKRVWEYVRKQDFVVFLKPPFKWQGVAYVREQTQAEINADLVAKIRRLEGQIATLKKKYLTHLDHLHPGV